MTSNTLIIGDLHACHAELLDLLDLAGLGSDDRIVAVGDLIDRGPEPAEVLAFFRDHPNASSVRGNHERKHLNIRDGTPLIHEDRVFGLDTGCCHGLRLTGLLLPAFRVLSVPARRDHWEEIRARYADPGELNWEPLRGGAGRAQGRGRAPGLAAPGAAGAARRGGGDAADPRAGGGGEGGGEMGQT
jgi:hypothetical protein